MRPSTVRLLLVEDNLDELCLFNELIEELQEEHTTRFQLTIDLLHALDLAEALDILSRTHVDLILLDTTLPGVSVAESLSILGSQHTDTPVVMLSDEESITDQVQMIRLGAQDVIAKSDLDCQPLARVLQFALERHKGYSALRSITYMDELTGLYNQTGFLEVSYHVMSLARRLDQSVTLLALSPARSAAMAEDSDLALIEAADLLRSAAESNSVIARYDRELFLVLVPRGTASTTSEFFENLDRACDDLKGRLGNSRASVTFARGAAYAQTPPPLEDLMAAARGSLCENENRTADARY